MPESAKEAEVVEAVAEWVTALVPELETVYQFATAGKAALPDVVIDVERTTVERDDPRFPHFQLQQAWLDVFEVVLSFMVDNTDAAAAAALLRDVGWRVREQVRLDGTLGQRVFLTSPFVEVDYVPQFVEYADGTRGRQAVARIVVANPAEVRS